MVDNGYVSREEGDKAKAEPLGVKPRRNGTYLFAGEYFTEEVRREIISRYGENALYEGGLSVRTTLDPKMQLVARKAMQNGLLKYDTLRGYRGPVKTIELGADWGVPLGEVQALADVPEWRLAVVLESSDAGLSIGLQPKREVSGKLGAERETGTVAAEDMSFAMRHIVDGKRVKANSPADVLKAGDVVYVEKKEGGSYLLRQIPSVSGGLVAMDPHTGRVLAMVGGFSYSQSEFNRATQAMRQPGSSFKPIVYAAALDNGYTPASVIMDGPITITSGGTTWTPKNYDSKSAGPSTLRAGIERSRNLMTVRLAHDMGMKIVAEYAERFGVYDHLAPYLPMALGSGETTVMRMVSAYSVMANGGRQIKPSLIDRIQDRYGKTVYKHDERACEGCVSEEWKNQTEPELIDNADQVLDPMTAYQITSMMEGVVLARHGDHAAGTQPPDRRQDRHDQRREGRLVHRLHAEPRRRPLCRLRPAADAWQGHDRRRPRRADLQGIHGRGAEGHAAGRLPGPRRHEPHRHQPQDRHARQRRRAGHDHGSVQARHRPGRHLLGHRHGCWRRDGRVALARGQQRDPDRRRRAVLSSIGMASTARSSH